MEFSSQKKLLSNTKYINQDDLIINNQGQQIVILEQKVNFLQNELQRQGERKQQEVWEKELRISELEEKYQISCRVNEELQLHLRITLDSKSQFEEKKFLEKGKFLGKIQQIEQILARSQKKFQEQLNQKDLQILELQENLGQSTSQQGELESVNWDLQNELKEREKVYLSLQESFQKEQFLCKEVRSDLAESQKELKDLKSQIKSKEQEILQLVEQNKQYYEEVNQLRKNVSHFQEQVTFFENKVQDLEEEKKFQEQFAQKLKQDLVSQKDFGEKLERENDLQREFILEVKKLGEKKGFGEERELDLGEVYQRVRGLVKKKRNYKSQVNKMDALVSDLNQQIVRLEGEVDRLSKEGEIKNREFQDEFQRGFEEIEQQIIQRNNEQEKEVEFLQKSLEKKKQEIDILRQEIQEKEQKWESSEQKSRNSENAKKNIEETLNACICQTYVLVKIVSYLTGLSEIGVERKRICNQSLQFYAKICVQIQEKNILMKIKKCAWSIVFVYKIQKYGEWKKNAENKKNQEEQKFLDIRADVNNYPMQKMLNHIFNQTDICSDQTNFENVRDLLRQENSISQFSQLFNKIMGIVIENSRKQQFMQIKPLLLTQNLDFKHNFKNTQKKIKKIAKQNLKASAKISQMENFKNQYLSLKEENEFLQIENSQFKQYIKQLETQEKTHSQEKSKIFHNFDDLKEQINYLEEQIQIQNQQIREKDKQIRKSNHKIQQFFNLLQSDDISIQKKIIELNSSFKEKENQNQIENPVDSNSSSFIQNNKN